jgi:hypothetical protein
MNEQEIIRKIGSELLTDGPNVPATEVVVRNQDVLLASNTQIQNGDKLFVYELNLGVATLKSKNIDYTAEQWINAQGYSSIRLITLLDLEVKLNALNRSSSKLQAVRSWIDTLLATYVQNQSSQVNWTAAPFSFEETVQEAFQALAN